MKIVITGAAGFIGSHLCDHFVGLGHTVVGIDDYSLGTPKNLDMSKDNFHFIRHDLRKPLTANLKDVDVVLHQAAWGSVPKSFKDPIGYIQNNVGSLINAMAIKPKRFVFASSSSVWQMSNQSPYTNSKRICENILRMSPSYFKNGCVVLRYFNVFGPRQRLDHENGAFIPRMIDSLHNFKSVKIYGSGDQTRRFTYIDNVVKANEDLCKLFDSQIAEEFDLPGPNSQYSVNDTVEIASGFLNKSYSVDNLDTRQGDVSRSPDSMGAIFTTQNPITFVDGLRRTCEWYQKNK